MTAWLERIPIGRGMVLFPEHEEYSASAVREACAEVRDVFVARPRRRLGVATAVMSELEDAAGANGMLRVGLSVALDDEAEPARALYERLGYRQAHGPYIKSTVLVGDDGRPTPVGAVMVFLTKEL